MTRELRVFAVLGLTPLASLSGNAQPLASFAPFAHAAGPTAALPAAPAAPASPPVPCATPSPDLCPMQAWMRANAAAPLAARDFGFLALVFGRLVAAAPPTFVNWASIARDGADAARVEDVEAVQGACRGCHAQYAARYHAQASGRPR